MKERKPIIISESLCNNSKKNKKIYSVLIILLLILPTSSYFLRIFFSQSETLSQDNIQDYTYDQYKDSITSLNDKTSYISSEEPNKNYYFHTPNNLLLGYNESSIYMVYLILNTFSSNRSEIFSIYNSSISLFMNITSELPINTNVTFELWKLETIYETISWNDVKNTKLIDTFSFVYNENENITIIFEGNELSKNINNHQKYIIKMSYIDLTQLGDEILNEGDFSNFILSSNIYNCSISISYNYLPTYYVVIIYSFSIISIICIIFIIYYNNKNKTYINYCNS